MGSPRETYKLQTITDKPYNAETPLPALLNEVTDSDSVYVRNHFDVPKIRLSEWALEVDGFVSEARSFSYSTITALPSKRLKMTLECAGNGRSSMVPLPAGTRWRYGAVSAVEFTGTSLSNLLDEVGLSEKAVEAVFLGSDQGAVAPGRTEPFARSLPLEVAQDPDVILAWEMNGEPLTPDHGFPVRLVVPGWYGMASVKWLRKITVAEEKFSGFFQDEHYVYAEENGTPEDEPVRHIRVRSLILDSSAQADGDIAIEGIAWSGTGAITRVEISQDGGFEWRDAELEPPHSRHEVQRWRYSLRPTGGEEITIASRATDSAGNTQPNDNRWNRLGYGNNGLHSVRIASFNSTNE